MLIVPGEAKALLFGVVYIHMVRDSFSPNKFSIEINKVNRAGKKQ